MSADCSDTCSDPSPRVAFFHSFDSVATIDFAELSRSGTSDGSSFVVSRGGVLTDTWTLKPDGLIVRAGISNGVVSVRWPMLVSHAMKCSPFPAGTRGAE